MVYKMLMVIYYHLTVKIEQFIVKIYTLVYKLSLIHGLSVTYQ